MTRYVLGLDGGGTRTRAVIVTDRGELCGIGHGGAANYNAVGVEAAQAHIGDAVAEARRQAGLDASSTLASAFLGMAGVVASRDHETVRGMAEALELVPDGVLGIDHDCCIALAGGLTGRPGIVLIVGTGSSCFGVNANGAAWRAGGWGRWISDEGSGYWLGTQALRAAVASHDGRFGPTVLKEIVMRQLEISDMDDILYRLYVTGLTKAETAALAPLVLDAARDGDATALALVTQGAHELAACVEAVATRLALRACELVTVGGLVQGSDLIQSHLREAVHARLPECRIVAPDLPPVLGACLLALRQLDVPLTPDIVRALHEGAAALSSPPDA